MQPIEKMGTPVYWTYPGSQPQTLFTSLELTPRDISRTDIAIGSSRNWY